MIAWNLCRTEESSSQLSMAVCEVLGNDDIIGVGNLTFLV